MGGISRKRMVEEAVWLLDGWTPKDEMNREYLRGMCELIARSFLKEDTTDEAEVVRQEIIAALVKAGVA